VLNNLPTFFDSTVPWLTVPALPWAGAPTRWMLGTALIIAVGVVALVFNVVRALLRRARVRTLLAERKEGQRNRAAKRRRVGSFPGAYIPPDDEPAVYRGYGTRLGVATSASLVQWHPPRRSTRARERQRILTNGRRIRAKLTDAIRDTGIGPAAAAAVIEAMIGWNRLASEYLVRIYGPTAYAVASTVLVAQLFSGDGGTYGSSQWRGRAGHAAKEADGLLAMFAELDRPGGDGGPR
jgi:hypothetical protein